MNPRSEWTQIRKGSNSIGESPNLDGVEKKERNGIDLREGAGRNNVPYVLQHDLRPRSEVWHAMQQRFPNREGDNGVLGAEGHLWASPRKAFDGFAKRRGRGAGD